MSGENESYFGKVSFLLKLPMKNKQKSFESWDVSTNRIPAMDLSVTQFVLMNLRV